MTLDRPREATVRQLYALSMNRCAFPECTTLLVTPSGTIVGEVCHIRAQNQGGLRYLDSQDDEERHGFDNLVLMCRNHHKEIDTSANLHVYTVEWLLKVKRKHEREGGESGEITAPAEVIKALVWTVTVYEAGATHMDFRNATFKVGGEGGGPGGGGGSGGVLTIVGIASLPPEIADEMTIDIDGGNGQFPGGGGGGGGVLIYEGRPASSDDMARGLQVPLLFPANGAAVADGLLYVLGAGWEYFWVTEFPTSAHINVAFMADFGSVDPNVLLRFDIKLTEPNGSELASQTVDIAVPERSGLINRTCRTVSMRVTVEVPGIYELSILSGGNRLARYAFEIKLR